MLDGAIRPLRLTAILLCCFCLKGSSSFAVEIISHRGLATRAHENTIEAMQAAWDAGADIVELDVRILVDDTLVLFHDEKIEGHSIYEITYPKLQELTPKYHVPTLRELLQACPRGRTLLLDLKDDTPRFKKHLIEAIQQMQNGPTLIYQSRMASILKSLKTALGQPIVLLVTKLKQEGLFKRPPDSDALAYSLLDQGIDGLSAKGRRFIDDKFVDDFKKRGLLFYVWTINDSKRVAYYISLNVDGVITDTLPITLPATVNNSLKNHEGKK